MNHKPAGEESEQRVPADLRKALATAPMARAQWRDLTPIARRDFISWIESAKQPETRRRRIERACSMLAAGKRRPCCYSIVSFNLYQALAATPMAKARWSDLTPVERRDFIGWMDSAKEPKAHRRRIEKACAISLRPESEAPDVFNLTKSHIMNQGTKRTILRCIHLVLSIPILGYIYEPASEVQQYAGAVRFVFVPVMILSGYWMYSGVIFAIIGVALWLGAYQLSGYGAALLSQVALFIARKIWLVIRARRSK